MVLGGVHGSTFDALYAAWWQHCGPFIPAETGSIPACGQYPALDVASSSHLGVNGTRGSILLLNWSHLFFGCTPAPAFPISQNCHMQYDELLH